ncbi:UDP-N-acetylglucosamine 1-carboxyvinyltransferase [Caminicella sporogenes DSM 14501]|uniref:UDP-N-acetylglucosamine 1-carboxyvinyltransferase n=1 Tax=Caminicella sporogenes DSM 14501 TaxID=1121266 RepID=A0A1M6L1I1_9FIRM|nr:UDP-N-acetylglucosamine 1-carboxyvinyltransferase [Caminicella sporogenes]RKD27672.1 UDP-N-acetylglucosamine 1-carboxyvinyltransferase [Caminicella sporogenes]SHJ65023.1 UDP-N-acetylglucosamine 1-carboxyvinyltransferase [Caminicella sporogenes DSM 14501]
MSKYLINGGNKLSGKIGISGAKNSVLPILAASIINGKENIIIGYPNLRDVETMIEILLSIGCKVKRDSDCIIVNSESLNTCEIPEHLVREMRSSIFLMGPMLGRCKKIKISYPGGCEIGPRPIDLHLKGLKEMGVNIIEAHGFLECSVEKLKGAEIHLDYPSVGATENIMMAAVLAEGKTVIRNAAKEPEILDLQDFLTGMGAKIEGAGTSIIQIEGVKSLNGVQHKIIPDRIVAGTILTAAAITKSEIMVENVIADHLVSTIAKLKEVGCQLNIKNNQIKIKPPKVIKSVEILRTLPYPGFPTDMQAQFMALLSIANGTSIVTETIFENRFKHTEELVRMGAKIKVDGRVAVIKGVKKLTGANVSANDLRGGAALVLAGLAAEGTTIVDNIHHIERGYDNLDIMFKNLGADIKRID